MLKVNNTNTRKGSEICKKLTKKTPDWNNVIDVVKGAELFALNIFTSISSIYIFNFKHLFV